MENGPVVPFGPRHRSDIKRSGTNGRRPEGMSTRPVRPDADDDGGPLDMVSVQADDALIDALAGGGTFAAARGRHHSDDHVASILAAWKADIDAEPIPELIDLDTAVATILEAARPPGRRLRRLAPVAAAAAVAVLALGGVTVGSAAAQPDSVFWPVSKVLFSERAASVEAADRAETHIAKAKVALSQGDPRTAAAELAAAQTDLGQVRPQEGKDQLADVQSFLVAKTDETPPGVKADLSAPLRRNPSRPVPPGSGLTSDPLPTGGSHRPRTSEPPLTSVPAVPVVPSVEATPPDKPTTTASTGGSEPTRETPAPTTTATATVEGTADAPASTTTGMGSTTTSGTSGDSPSSTTPT